VLDYGGADETHEYLIFVERDQQGADEAAEAFVAGCLALGKLPNGDPVLDARQQCAGAWCLSRGEGKPDAYIWVKEVRRAWER
jgi:hypothetical protein